MWEDIKRWIVFIYLATGFIYALETLVNSEAQFKGFQAILYIGLCVFTWLPITIVSWIIG